MHASEHVLRRVVPSVHLLISHALAERSPVVSEVQHGVSSRWVFLRIVELVLGFGSVPVNFEWVFPNLFWKRVVVVRVGYPCKTNPLGDELQ